MSTADRSVIYLSHKPVTSVSSVTNLTTGEVYVIDSQNLDDDSGLNEDGTIEISGKTLPMTSDLLSVNYIWRLYYDRYVDYNGETSPSMFIDSSAVDAVDWGVSNGIKQEESIVEKTDDNLEYKVDVDYNISRVVSVFSANNVSAVAKTVNIGGVDLLGMEVDAAEPVISNIVSITSSGGVEVYKTNNNDGTFSGRLIAFPTDTSGASGSTYTVRYNKVELYDIDNSDGSFSNNIIILPSSDILTASSILDDVEDLFNSGDEIYVDYIADILEILPSQTLSSLPASGASNTNILRDSSFNRL